MAPTIFKPVPSSDPILAYVYDAVNHYGYDSSDCKERALPINEYVDFVRVQTSQIVEQLFPGQTIADLARWCNLPLQTTRNAVIPGSRAQRKVDVNRVLLLNMLVHIAGIRDTLMDIERQIWVTMQLTHDPRVCYDTPPPPHAKNGSKPGMSTRAKAARQRAGLPPLPEDAYDRADKRRRAHQQRVRKALAEGKPPPKDGRAPVIMPFRALRMLDLPVTNANPAQLANLTPQERERREEASRLLKAENQKIRAERVAAGIATRKPIVRKGQYTPGLGKHGTRRGRPPKISRTSTT